MQAFHIEAFFDQISIGALFVRHIDQKDAEIQPHAFQTFHVIANLRLILS